MMRRAKIVGTLGPASEDRKTVGRLLSAGLDVVRLNLSHGTRDGHRRAFQTVRELAAERGIHVPIILDLMGPRYRLSRHQQELTLRRGSVVGLGLEGANTQLLLDDSELISALSTGNRVLIDNGLVELRVHETSDQRASARVRTGGVVGPRKGINLPDSDLPFVVSDKDREDIALAVELDADFIAASYVGSADDVEAVRRTVRAAGGNIPVIAKLERARAVTNLQSLVASADAVMVARGDLGVEVPLHKVPILQKRIIESGREHGKPVIVATQMLESMIKTSRPTRAESSDVANAVFDGADALMLSGESAVGRHPVEAVRTMNKIIREAESYARSSRFDLPMAGRLETRGLADQLAEPSSAETRGAISAFDIADTIAAVAVQATMTLGLRHVVAFSQGGFTARVISRHRPAAPIWMLTIFESVARRVQLSWGVRPLLLNEDVEHHDEIINRVDCELLSHGLAKPGEGIAVLMGDPIRERPLTNLLRIHRVRPDAST